MCTVIEQDPTMSQNRDGESRLSPPMGQGGSDFHHGRIFKTSQQEAQRDFVRLHF